MVPLHERDETQLVLWLSMKHQPKVSPGDYYMDADAAFMYKNNRSGDHFADIILVRDYGNAELPEWLKPVMAYANDNDYSLVVFTESGVVVDYLPTYGK